jgi:negative modulator of initiation of replication
MRTIEIEDDVYFYLLGRAADTEVSYSEILRRAFGLGGSALHVASTAHEGPPSEVEQWTRSPRFLAETTALGRFMCLLYFLYAKHGDGFDVVLDLAGRKRRYFATSADELDQAGQSVFPKQIAGSPYWVVTNTETAKKRQLIESVMRMLGYGGSDTRIAASAI